ncbi:hypothetical protein RBSWK_01847 [Rhodopirellula baltica SWK14]|uniref:Uncharacterized protein n=1 Tax=Rhodopirellula baltica SWK14 TaxID=993516 RepID=L7CKA0_RHOBT|nr:hypothetical protein RBSWK_01847 [Rhodopirellula baltica SWK14]
MMLGRSASPLTDESALLDSSPETIWQLTTIQQNAQAQRGKDRRNRDDV